MPLTCCFYAGWNEVFQPSGDNYPYVTRSRNTGCLHFNRCWGWVGLKNIGSESALQNVFLFPQRFEAHQLEREGLATESRCGSQPYGIFPMTPRP
jgi:hypothetical protein